MPTTEQAPANGHAAPSHGDHEHPGDHGDGDNMHLAMSHVATFADMLKMNVGVRRILQFPDWLTFPDSYTRKDQADFTEYERQRFLCAWEVLNANGTLGTLVDIHSDMTHDPHGTQRFLPWHRVYLVKLEQALRAVHPDVVLPYWDWTNSSEQAIPPWLVGVTPTVVTPTQTINVVRSPQSASDLSMLASNTPATLAQTMFDSFTSMLQGIHDGVHVWVGGSMGWVATAPADPLFWMHHCNIDRLWWVWQNMAGNAGKNPALSGAGAVMDPWPNTEADTRDTMTLGYGY